VQVNFNPHSKKLPWHSYSEPTTRKPSAADGVTHGADTIVGLGGNKDRLMAAIDYFNQNPVVHTWSYKLDEVA
jgi:hypothetical protein